MKIEPAVPITARLAPEPVAMAVAIGDAGAWASDSTDW